MAKDKRKELDLLEKELNDVVVSFGDASSSIVCNRDSVQESVPVASLEIPNKLYWLWKKKIDLLRNLNLSIPSYTQLLNDRIGGTIKASEDTSVESRIYKESSRFLSTYKQYNKKGSSCRRNYLLCTTKMLLFSGEVETISTHQADITAQTSTQASSTIPVSGKTSYDDLKDRQRQYHKKTLCNSFQSFSEDLHVIGLELQTVQLRRMITDKIINLDIHQCRTAKRHYHPDEKDDDKSHDPVPMIAKLMLTYGISYECYHELTQLEKHLPRTYIVKEYRNSLPVPKITKAPGEFEGAQFTFRDVLELRLTEEVMVHEEYYIEHNYHVRIRISGDGARYSRTSSYCLLSFGFMREHQCSLSPANLCTLAVIKGGEDYEHLAVGFRDIFNEINTVIANPTITIDGKKCTLEFFLCADYKFLLTLMGMKSATCKYACIWCTIDKDDRYEYNCRFGYDMSIDIPNDDIKTRELEDFRADGKYCNDKLPLLNIPLSHIIPDELHLLLRVTDVLIEALITTAIACDRYEHHFQAESRHRGGRLKVYKTLEGNMLTNLLAAINACHVQFKMWLEKEKEKDKEKLKWTSLMGPDKRKLLKTLPDNLNETCQPKDMVKDVKKLWKDFEEIYNIISSPRPTLSGELLTTKGKAWVNLFLKLGAEPFSDGYQPKEVTPYLHSMVYHFPYFMEKFHNVKQFSCQGVEKNNDLAKKTYFRNSNKWDSAADIIKHQYQLWLLKNRKRKIGAYCKNKKGLFWEDGGLQESRRKRMRISHPANIDSTEVVDTVDTSADTMDIAV